MNYVCSIGYDARFGVYLATSSKEREMPMLQNGMSILAVLMIMAGTIDSILPALWQSTNNPLCASTKGHGTDYGLDVIDLSTQDPFVGSEPQFSW